MDPLIISAAVTGNGPAKSKFHPVTPEAVVEEAIASWRAGAAMIHIHARLADGSASSDVAAFRAIVQRIEAAGCDAIISASAGDEGGRASHEERLLIPDAGVEVVTLNTGSFNTRNRLYNNPPSYIRAMALRQKELNVTPEVEVFNPSNLDFVNELVSEGVLRSPAFVLFVFGVSGGMGLDPRLLPLLRECLPAGSQWSVCAKTNNCDEYLRLEMVAFSSGGHVRTGMEDHAYLRPGELAQSNAALVQQWVETARTWGRPVASPAVAREILGIRPVRRAAIGGRS